MCSTLQVCTWQLRFDSEQTAWQGLSFPFGERTRGCPVSTGVAKVLGAIRRSDCVIN